LIALWQALNHHIAHVMATAVGHLTHHLSQIW
jgi:hypothetical protein